MTKKKKKVQALPRVSSFNDFPDFLSRSNKTNVGMKDRKSKKRGGEVMKEEERKERKHEAAWHIGFYTSCSARSRWAVNTLP